MCGIAGRANFKTGAPLDAAVIQAMTELIAHRGPDGSGVNVSGSVGFGHRRLAVIDLTSAGRQPMIADDGVLWVTYNGEIYNFQEIRTVLQSYGHTFRSRTDTEVILAAYRQWDVDCLSRFRGMFAFALWDSRTRSLLLARDRLGNKPLHYWVDSDGIAFESEPKAFLADPRFKATADLIAISHFLSLQYVPSPLSAFQGVRKLPPAHYLLVRDGRIAVERYWKLRYGSKRPISEADASEELLSRLREAVRLRLISDVPLGAFLSGGIDSGAVVALMAEAASGPVRTF